ncbi:unnamed protein product [Ranitomeya imitator]|uniref:Rhodanese domain-containing protein n=1 Tax=Ranitomeya imitator TaxID=111125 RepID=A0ABN9M8B2_9NEOB|nr:unnamed protein product [Ranitomeya imitator]
MLDIRAEMLDTGAEMLDTGAEMLDTGAEMLDTGGAVCWTRAEWRYGCRTLNILSNEERDNCSDISLSQLEDRNLTWVNVLTERLSEVTKSTKEMGNKVIVICKLGNDSQKAVKILQEFSNRSTSKFEAKDIIGGLMAWSGKIDSTFPQY